MSRATAKAGAEGMATFQKNLLYRGIPVLWLVGAAFLFCGAAFSPGNVRYSPSVDFAALRLGANLSGVGSFPGAASASRPAACWVGRRSPVLRQLEEILLTERAVSTAV